MRRQESQWSHESCSFSRQLSALASVRAMSALPVPPAPAKRYAWASRPFWRLRWSWPAMSLCPLWSLKDTGDVLPDLFPNGRDGLAAIDDFDALWFTQRKVE